MPRFVLLEHRWDGVHWDLMLERADGSALCTWALDEPLVAGRDLPARGLADHRTAYLDYEGPVSGGRGSVRRVDRGTYEALAWDEGSRVVVRLAGGQLVGTATLVRAGSEGRGDRQSDAPPTGYWTLRLGNFD